MIHLTPQQLSSYMDGELNEASTELVRRHMGACEECTLKFASLEVQEDLLSRALVHDPGDEFFAEFTAAVERQIPTGKDSGAKPASLAAARPSPPRATPTPAAKPAAQAAPPAAGPPRPQGRRRWSRPRRRTCRRWRRSAPTSGKRARMPPS